MGNILSRIQEIALNEGITIGALERKIGASKGVLSRAINNGTDIQSKWLQSMVENYPTYSTRWLITGEGSMFHGNKNPEESKRSNTPISPTEEYIIYKMYKEKDEENKALIRENGRLEERIRQLEFQNKESEHPSIVDNITEAFTKESSGDYGEDSRSTKLLSGSKRSSVGKV